MQVAGNEKGQAADTRQEGQAAVARATPHVNAANQFGSSRLSEHPSFS